MHETSLNSLLYAVGLEQTIRHRRTSYDSFVHVLVHELHLTTVHWQHLEA